MERLISITSKEDIPAVYNNTPISLLIDYHNFQRKSGTYQKAQILVGMCMDHRKFLRVPPNFAYIIRTGGANLQSCDFYISYAIAIGKISTIALIAHNDCGMRDLFSKKEQFVKGLMDAGWDREQATEHFLHHAPLCEIENEIDFMVSETARLRLKYPKITVAPLFYNIEDNLLYLIKEEPSNYIPVIEDRDLPNRTFV